MKINSFNLLIAVLCVLFITTQTSDSLYDLSELSYFKVDVRSVLISLSDCKSVEDDIGFSLEPPEGKVFLPMEERSALLNALKKTKSYEPLATTTLRGHPHRCNEPDSLEEVPYVANYDLNDARKGIITPTVIQRRSVGSYVHFHAQEIPEEGVVVKKPDSGIIYVELFVDFSFLNGYDKFSQDVSQPIFKVYSIKSFMYIPDGMTYATKAIIPQGIDHLKNGNNAEREESKCYLFLFTVAKEPDIN